MVVYVDALHDPSSSGQEEGNLLYGICNSKRSLMKNKLTLKYMQYLTDPN